MRIASYVTYKMDYEIFIVNDLLFKYYVYITLLAILNNIHSFLTMLF